MLRRLLRGAQIQRAFFRLGWLGVASYPLAFVATNVSSVVPIVIYYFVAQFVDQTGSAVGGDYFTFIVIGVVVAALLNAGLQGFGGQLDMEIKSGRLEALLVEPISWRLVPFGLVQFSLVAAAVLAGLTMIVSVFLGAQYKAEGVLPAAAIIFLGVLATLGIGILGSSIRILAKRADPLLSVYTVLASVLSGVLFPVAILPFWLKPVAYLLPHTYVISATRRVLMPGGGEIAGPSLTVSLVALVLLLGQALTTPAAAARLVVTRTREPAPGSAESTEPPLNPNQPSQSRKAPINASGRLCPAMGRGFPSMNLPSRGPSIQAATRAPQPPTPCTMVDPAKSWKPSSCSQPPPHFHMPTMG